MGQEMKYFLLQVLDSISFPSNPRSKDDIRTKKKVEREKEKNLTNPKSEFYRSQKKKHYADCESAKTSFSTSSAQFTAPNSSASFSSALEKSRFSSFE